MTDRGSEEPWQWPDETWRTIVSHVRAGRNARPPQWKNGARCAVALSFDSDHETIELRFGRKSFGRLRYWASVSSLQTSPFLPASIIAGE